MLNKIGLRSLALIAMLSTLTIAEGNKTELIEVSEKDIRLAFPKAKIIKSTGEISKLDKVNDGISYTFGTGSTELYLVIGMNDKSAKILKKLESKSDQVKVHVIFHGAIGFNVDHTKKIAWILLGENDKEKQERTNKILLENSTWYKWVVAYKNIVESGDTQDVVIDIDKAKTAIKLLEVKDIPSVFDKDLKLIEGK